MGAAEDEGVDSPALEGQEVLLGHESVDDDPARVRLVATGPYSLDFEIFAYLKTSDWNESLAIREELLMHVLREIEAAGTALAPPAQTTYLRSDDDEPGDAADVSS